MSELMDFPLPPNLPRPLQDGATEHLWGKLMPQISLPSTGGRMLDLSDVREGYVVLYCYPMTGLPGRPLPEGWDMVPGARGCTPEALNFRERYPEISRLNAKIFGLSTQSSEYQKEMAMRLQLPFEILSDSEFKLCDALNLPTFEVNSMRLVRRLTLLIYNGRIRHVFYPVFPANEAANEVAEWLQFIQPWINRQRGA